jgi:hypothetical protein
VPVPSPYGIVGVEWMAGDCRDKLSTHKIVLLLPNKTLEPA